MEGVLPDEERAGLSGACPCHLQVALAHGRRFAATPARTCLGTCG